MIEKVNIKDVFGLVRPENDIHTLGISTVGKLLEDCGYKVEIADANITKAIASISKLDNISMLKNWILDKKITRLGFSYRLDPINAQKSFGKVIKLIEDNKLLKTQGGTIVQIYFAGLPEACDKIDIEYNKRFPSFIGDETQYETLIKLGINEDKIPVSITKSSKYDDERNNFAKQLIYKGDYNFQIPIERSGYKDYGTFEDSLVKRINFNRLKNKLPLIRVHVGPYNDNYTEALKEFKSWLKILAETNFLDIVSIGSSQLSQSEFGKDWGNKPNGGGVPINSEKDLREIWDAARPMLVRTYSSTRNVAEMAEIYEKTINIAWHALSFWWFNKIDGRGPYGVKENLDQHINALNFIAKSGKPFEPNIPHHFSFRGGDDYTYVLSSYLAAKTAKKIGIKYFVLQTMLNTPKYTWGVQDIAKSRALLLLTRELEDSSFKVYHQPRAGLDYFSPNLDKAKVQLASVSAMMDDIEPNNLNGPDIIHVVSYCEAVSLATPSYINESIQITLKSIQEYRKLKKEGFLEEFLDFKDVKERTNDLYNEIKSAVKILEKEIPDLYSAKGLYEVFKRGVFAVPYLWEGRQEFSEAIKWNTGLYNGAVHVLDQNGLPIKLTKRIKDIF